MYLLAVLGDKSDNSIERDSRFSDPLRNRRVSKKESKKMIGVLTLSLLAAAAHAALQVLDDFDFSTYQGKGLSPTVAGALNSTSWRVDLVQDTNSDNLYGTNKTFTTADQLGRGLVNASGPFSGGIGAVQINAATRALFLQPTTDLFTPGFVEFRTKYSGTNTNTLVNVTVRWCLFFVRVDDNCFVGIFFFFFFSSQRTPQVEIYFWHLNNAPRGSTWKIGFYSGDTPALDVDSNDERHYVTVANTSSAPAWVLEKTEFVFQTQYTSGDDYLFIRIAGDDTPGTTSGQRDTIAISEITVLAEPAGSSGATTTTVVGGSTTSAVANGSTTSSTTTSGGTPSPTSPGETTTSTSAVVGESTTSTLTTTGAVGVTTTAAGGSTTLVTADTAAGAMAALASLAAAVAAVALAL
jgi:hypothetical protein